MKDSSKTTKSTTEIKSSRNYMDLAFSRAPKNNHDDIEQIGKPFVQWLKRQGVRTEIYYLNSSEVPEGLESIAKLLSLGDNEEIWVLLQFYKDRDHADEVTAKMMQDESIGLLMKKFDGLITQSIITGGFSRLRS